MLSLQVVLVLACAVFTLRLAARNGGHSAPHRIRACAAPIPVLALLALAAFMPTAAYGVEVYVSAANGFVGDGSVGQYIFSGNPPATSVSSNQWFLGPGLYYPGGMAVIGDNLYVDNQSAYGLPSSVGKYTRSGGTGSDSFITGIYNSTGAIVALGSHLLVGIGGAGGTGRIAVYDAITGASVNPNLVTGLTGPGGLAISGSHLFVADSGSGGNSGTVGEYDLDTGTAINASLLSGLSGPFGLAVSGSNLYVTNFGTTTVGEYTLGAGTITASNPSFISGLPYVTGLSAYGSDLFVVTNRGGAGEGTVGEFDAVTGAAVNANLITGSYENNFVTAVADAPEPASLALLALGAAGLLIRRRRR